MNNSRTFSSMHEEISVVPLSIVTAATAWRVGERAYAGKVIISVAIQRGTAPTARATVDPPAVACARAAGR